MCCFQTPVIARHVYHLSIGKAHEGRLVSKLLLAFGTNGGVVHFETLLPLLFDGGVKAYRLRFEKSLHYLPLMLLGHLSA